MGTVLIRDYLLSGTEFYTRKETEDANLRYCENTHFLTHTPISHILSVTTCIIYNVKHVMTLLL